MRYLILVLSSVLSLTMNSAFADQAGPAPLSRPSYQISCQVHLLGPSPTGDLKMDLSPTSTIETAMWKAKVKLDLGQYFLGAYLDDQCTDRTCKSDEPVLVVSLIDKTDPEGMEQPKFQVHLSGYASMIAGQKSGTVASTYYGKLTYQQINYSVIDYGCSFMRVE